MNVVKAKIFGNKNRPKMAASDRPEEDFVCPVCLDFYEKPFTISCNHSFCLKCLGPFLTVAEPNCPMCRGAFVPSERKPATQIEKAMSNTRANCKTCNKCMVLSKMKSHVKSCSSDGSAPTPTPLPLDNGAILSQDSASIIDTNRSTFTCPICAHRNLDCSSLVRHCKQDHESSSQSVVCPICAAMPWGDPSMASRNFIGHLTLRHRFEYDTFVDYGEDEDKSLAKALQRSLVDK